MHTNARFCSLMTNCRYSLWSYLSLRVRVKPFYIILDLLIAFSIQDSSKRIPFRPSVLTILVGNPKLTSPLYFQFFQFGNFGRNTIAENSKTKYLNRLLLFNKLQNVLEDCSQLLFIMRGGYRGFYSRNTIPLTPKVVNDIHKRGGTIIGTSRGGHDTSKIVDSIQDRGINQEVRRRGLKVAVVAIPKTIDNDIPVIDKSFGFDTAVEEAQRAINAAHVEAESAENGVGVVKLMGRYSGNANFPMLQWS
ncbi:6-phosphofructokinase [Sarracenia purpurea var. burkii]